MKQSTLQPLRLFLCLCMGVFMICSISVQAQSSSKKIQFGAELDALPYITGGWFAAGWVGKEHVRARVLTAGVNMPEFITKEGFSNHRITSYAVVVDYFLKESWKGWWAGAGLVYWKSSIQTDAHLQTADFKNYLLNGSIGYNIPLYKKLYLSPWAGMSIRAGGDKNVAVDAKQFSLPLLNPEASLKLGISF
ncbi:MAG: hypothetical protein ACOVP7_10480 [Lacibacter sp.]